MLTLTRKEGERVQLDLGDGRMVWITVWQTKRGEVRLSFEAPRTVTIMREELLPEEKP